MNHGLSAKYISDEDIAWAIENGYWKALLCGLGLRASHSDVRSMKEQLLHILVRESTVEVVAALLDSGIDINTREGDKTALHIAIERGDSEMVACLLSRGASVRSGQLSEWERPLVMMVDERVAQSAMIVRALLEAGADPNPIPGSLQHPLAYFSSAGSTEIVRELIPYVADAKAQRKDGWTALMFATCRGHMEIVKLLLDAGADPNIATSNGNCALTEALKHEHREIETMLREAGAARPADVDRDLHRAFVWRERDTVTRLLSEGADIESINAEGSTPLMTAIKFFPEAVPILIAHGADIHASAQQPEPDQSPTEPLVLAIRHQHAIAVEALLLAGADTNGGTNSSGWSPLHHAAHCGDVEILRLLMKHGAHIEAKNRQGDTPLSEAVRFPRPEIVRELIALGADIHLIDKAGNNLLEIVLQTNWVIRSKYAQTDIVERARQVVEILREAGLAPEATSHRNIPEREDSREAIAAYLNSALEIREHYEEPLSPIMRAVMASREDILDLYLETGELDWNECAGYRTAFEHAVLSGNTELVELALRSGADPNARTYHSRPVLYEAIKSSNPKIVEIIVRAGARLDEYDDFGNALLSEAFRDLAHNHDLFTTRVLVELGADREQILHAAAEGSDEIVLWLLANGADVNCQDDHGYTPLHNAVNHMTQFPEDDFDVGVIELLLRHGADPKVLTKEGQSALSSICWSSSTSAASVAKLLLDAGAQSNEGVPPPLMCAAISGDAELIRVLISAGANICVTDEYGDTPWLVAEQRGGKEIADLLERLGGAVEPAGIEDDIHRAIRWNKTDAAIRLIRNGADVEQADLAGMTPLMSAIYHWQNIGIVRELVAHGANVQAQVGESFDWSSWSALDFTASKLNCEIAKLLLERGADPDGEGRQYTSLMMAVPYYVIPDEPLDHGKVLEYSRVLLEFGANPNAIDNGEGYAPMHRAAIHGHIPLVELLLTYGADIDIPSQSDNGTGATPLIVAIQMQQWDMAEYLLQCGADVKGVSLMWLFWKYDEEQKDKIMSLARRLIEAGVDINAVDRRGHTLLDNTEDPSLREELIRLGAIANVRQYDEE